MEHPQELREIKQATDAELLRVAKTIVVTLATEYPDVAEGSPGAVRVLIFTLNELARRGYH